MIEYVVTLLLLVLAIFMCVKHWKYLDKKEEMIKSYWKHRNEGESL